MSVNTTVGIKVKQMNEIHTGRVMLLTPWDRRKRSKKKGYWTLQVF